MKSTLAAGAAAVFAPAGLGNAAGRLSWKHMPAGQNGFFRAPVLISGASEAVLIDGGFTFPDGRAVVEAIKASGKKVVHVTPPLVFDTAENPPKLQFRDWMFQTFPSDVIYDIQDVESTHPTTGARCQVGGVWRICQEVRSTASCLSPQSGPGGDDASQGHLCPTQATRIAPSFLYAIYLAIK